MGREITCMHRYCLGQQNVLQEGKVYLLTKFLCNESRTNFRTVESPYMIQFTRYSDAVLRPGLEADYPFCTYSLVPFQDLPRPTTTPARFIDVIGRITAVSDIIPIQSMHQPEPSNTRTIILTDLQGQELKLVLWGDRALEFEEEAVRARNEKQVVIAIFIGTLPKINQGIKGLSGSSACRWYIDEDLPDINNFRTRLGTNFKPIAAIATSEEGALPPRVYEDSVEKTVLELTQLDPFENAGKRFLCTATVQRLNTDQRWWFFSCSTCNKTSTMVGSQFRCTNPTCQTIEAEPTYCVSVYAFDDTTEAEFMLFDKVAKGAVGKPLMSLLRYRNPGHATIQEIARLPMVDTVAPPEVTRIVGQKYKLLVSISNKSFAVTSTQLSFQIVKIMETYKPELSSSAFDCFPGTPGASSSTSLADSPMPSGMFAPNTPNITHTQASYSSGSLAVGYQTPAGETRTPTSKISVGLLPTASPGKSPCPSRSARRVLFVPGAKNVADAKKTTAPEEPVLQSDKTAEATPDAQADASSLDTEEKDDQTQTPKNKRNSGGAKGAGAGKKSKQ